MSDEQKNVRQLLNELGFTSGNHDEDVRHALQQLSTIGRAYKELLDAAREVWEDAANGGQTAHSALVSNYLIYRLASAVADISGDPEDRAYAKQWREGADERINEEVEE